MFEDHINQQNKYIRSGFTLIEMVTSLAIMSVIMLGLSGAVMIGAHAVPTAKDTGIADQEVVDALNQFRSDIRGSATIQYRSSGSTIQIKLVMDSSDELGAPEKVAYEYSGDDDTFARIVDSLDPVIILSEVSSCVLSVTKDGSDASVVYLMMVVDETIQRFFEIHVVMPDKPEVVT